MTVEYDGTDFAGYQRQSAGERTVQSVLEEAVRAVGIENTVLHAAGRTDTGVHALGQVVSFQTEAKIPIERLAIALNSNLPRDLAIAHASEAESGFHARFSAKARTYGYLVWTRRTRSAIWGRYSLHYRRPLDLEAMRAGSRFLIGSHDFAAFARSGGDPGPTTVRDLKRLALRPLSNGSLLITVTANAFLRSMVRNIVGTLLEVGAGDLAPEEVGQILKRRDRKQNPCAPAAPQGLFLRHVEY